MVANLDISCTCRRVSAAAHEGAPQALETKLYFHAVVSVLPGNRENKQSVQKKNCMTAGLIIYHGEEYCSKLNFFIIPKQSNFAHHA